MGEQAFSLHTTVLPNNKWKTKCDLTEELSYVIMNCGLYFIRKEEFQRLLNS